MIKDLINRFFGSKDEEESDEEEKVKQRLEDLGYMG
jgi:hypothetical protein